MLECCRECGDGECSYQLNGEMLLCDAVLEELSSMVVHCKRDAHDVYIGRPSVWGNPFSHKDGTRAKYKVATRDEAITRYREWLMAQPELVARARKELRGKVLGCWCKPQSCHGDVLAEVANS